ncbi:hypothetical protein G6F68_017422 [Rhizopus microsporus]|nr:hypothetical protein G6F68_017422 [Rhizopus microsporus]
MPGNCADPPFFHARLDHGAERLALDLTRAAGAQARHFHGLVRAGQHLLGHAGAQLEFFGIRRRRAQHGRDVVGDLVAGDRQHRRVADRAAGEDGDIGRAAADVDQHDAEFFLVGSRSGVRT